MDDNHFKEGSWLDKLNRIHEGRLQLDAVEEHRKLLWFRTKEQAAKHLFNFLVTEAPFNKRAQQLGLI